MVSTPQIARFMGPMWGPPGSCRPQMGPVLAPLTLLSGSAASRWLDDGKCWVRAISQNKSPCGYKCMDDISFGSQYYKFRNTTTEIGLLEPMWTYHQKHCLDKWMDRSLRRCLCRTITLLHPCTIYLAAKTWNYCSALLMYILESTLLHFISKRQRS